MTPDRRQEKASSQQNKVLTAGVAAGQDGDQTQARGAAGEGPAVLKVWPTGPQSSPGSVQGRSRSKPHPHQFPNSICQFPSPSLLQHEGVLQGLSVGGALARDALGDTILNAVLSSNAISNQHAHTRAHKHTHTARIQKLFGVLNF